MATERLAQEEKSIWDLRLFKVGFVAVGVGWLINSNALLTVGFAAMGGAWAMKK